MNEVGLELLFRHLSIVKVVKLSSSINRTHIINSAWWRIHSSQIVLIHFKIRSCFLLEVGSTLSLDQGGE